MTDADWTRYTLVVDTDAYAGNFERQLVAYCTGMADPSGVGESEAAAFRASMPVEVRDHFAAIMSTRPGDNDHPHYARILPTTGRLNDKGRHFDANELTPELRKAFPMAYESVGVFFDEIPSRELLDILLMRAEEFAANYTAFGDPARFRILGMRLLAEVTSVVEVDLPAGGLAPGL